MQFKFGLYNYEYGEKIIPLFIIDKEYKYIIQANNNHFYVHLHPRNPLEKTKKIYDKYDMKEISFDVLTNKSKKLLLKTILNEV